MKNKIVKKYDTVSVLVLLTLTLIISFSMGFLISNNSNKNKSGKEMEKIKKEYDYILKNYNGKIDKNIITDGAIKGMIDSLDDKYSSFEVGEDKVLTGQYQGFGLSIAKTLENETLIVEVIKGSSAEKEKIMANDLILKVDDKKTEDLTNDEIVDYIGKKNEINLEVKRDEEILKFKLKKQQVVLESVESKVLEENKEIGYIRIETFAFNTAEQFNKHLIKLEKENIKTLIIDLRYNGGGYLSTTTKIIDLLLDDKKISYQTDDNGKIEKFYSLGTKTTELNIVIMINKYSASGSEMLSAALKENINATLVGQKSFGKGTVQEVKKVDDDSSYKLTTKYWLTPNGNNINEKGLTPDIILEPGIDMNKDTELEETIKIISEN